MSYLLDTHTLLWWLDNNPTLSLSTREVIANPNNLIFVSAVMQLVRGKSASKKHLES